MDTKYLLDIGLIILFSRLFNIITEKINFPKVIGSLLAGVILGPAVLNLVQSTKEFEFLADVSMIFIMFLIGMQTKLKKLIAGSKKFIIIAFLGCFFPLGCGIIVSRLYSSDPSINLFFGLALMISSVCVTIDSLVELKKLKTNVGMAILGAGVIDDIIGIIVLTLIQNRNNLSIKMFSHLILDFIIFALLAIIIGIIMYCVFKIISKKEHNYIPIYAVSYAFILAFIADYFSLSGVIGAYIAGLVMGTTNTSTYTKNHIEDIVNIFFNPISFSSIGLKLSTLSFSTGIWGFIILYSLVAIIGKVIGAGIGADICGYKPKEKLQIGIGMASRSEVALIITNTCLTLQIINEEMFSIVIISAILVSIISTLILSLTFEQEKEEFEETEKIKAN